MVQVLYHQNKASAQQLHPTILFPRYSIAPALTPLFAPHQSMHSACSKLHPATLVCEQLNQASKSKPWHRSLSTWQPSQQRHMCSKTTSSTITSSPSQILPTHQITPNVDSTKTASASTTQPVAVATYSPSTRRNPLKRYGRLSQHLTKHSTWHLQLSNRKAHMI